MTDEPTDFAWDIFAKDVFTERTHVVAFPGQPHRLASSRVGWASQLFWGGAPPQEDFVPYQFAELTERSEALVEVGVAVESLTQHVANLSAEIRSLKKEIAELRAEQGERPISTVATIHDLGRDDMSLEAPIQIIVEEYPEEVVAKFPEVGAIATADSEFEAIELLKADIAGLYLDLKAMARKKMGRAPRRSLQILSRLLR